MNILADTGNFGALSTYDRSEYGYYMVKFISEP